MVSVDFVFGAFPGEALGREEGERKHVSCRPGKTDPGDHAFLIALRLGPSSAIGWGLLVAAACPPFLGKPGVNTCSSPREAWGPRGKLYEPETERAFRINRGVGLTLGAPRSE